MSTKVRVGCIGAGWWATANHMPLLAGRDDVELAAVCRLGAAELEQVRARFGFTYATGLAAIWLMVGWIVGDFLGSLFIHRKLRQSTEHTGFVRIRRAVDRDLMAHALEHFFRCTSRQAV